MRTFTILSIYILYYYCTTLNREGSTRTVINYKMMGEPEREREREREREIVRFGFTI